MCSRRSTSTISSEAVHAAIARLTEEGMFTEEEIGTVLADSETFGVSRKLTTPCC